MESDGYYMRSKISPDFWKVIEGIMNQARLLERATLKSQELKWRQPTYELQ